ncbi:MFS general substrate transporter [Marasmius fiardii PR-910]|nr:MFS general substrate transporter [Marasmius fiardii PR-910]
MDSDTEKSFTNLQEKPVQKAESGSGASINIDRDAERRLLRKLDWYLLPLFGLIYCTNFVDRSGNAKISGIEKDLRLVGFDYNIALTVFYIFFLAAEIPSNLALKHFGSWWLAAMVTTFGVVAIGTAFVTSFAGLLVTRVFLGIAEGGTLSGLTYLLSRYYRRSELVFRIGVFFGTSPGFAGAFGGLLASGILSVDDIGTVKSWRKIFLVDLTKYIGIITTGIGLLCFLILPTDPQHTRMFNEEERALALARLDADQSVKTQGRKEKTSLKLIIRSFNFNTTICAICYLLINISFQGLSLFMPTVITTFPLTFHHTAVVESQLRTVPPYLVGAVWAAFCAYSSFRLNQRAIFILLSVSLMVLGYALAVGTKDPHARYAACFLSITGGSNAGPMVLAWGTGNAAPDTIKAVTTAIIPGHLHLSSVWTYLPTDAPDYHKGNSLNLATSSFTCVLVIIAVLYIRLENAKRTRGERNYRLEGKSPREIEELGYLHPEFRYQV